MTGQPLADPDRLPLAVRCRLAFLEGATEEWRAIHGREPTADELARMVARCPVTEPVRR